MNEYLCIDLETGIQEKHKRKGNPWYNNIVAAGYSTESFTKSEYTSDKNLIMSLIPTTTRILVGHNIKYDLLYLWETERLQCLLKEYNLKIWDTQLAEYILTGQQHKFPALRDIAVNKYGRPQRSKQMEEYWDNTIKVLDWTTKKLLKSYPISTPKELIFDDFPFESIDIIYGPIDTKDIPKELVEEDVLNDVLDTKAIYLKQLDLAEKAGQLNLIKVQMDALLATTEMEYNGIQVDLGTFNSNKNKLKLKAKQLEMDFNTITEKHYPNIDINSPQQLGLLFFGGEVKEIIKEPKKDEKGNLILFKSGKNIGEIKFEYKTIIKKIPGLGLKPFRKSEKTGKPSTDDQTLQLISKRKDTEAGKIASILVGYRETTKQIGTYYDGVLPLIYEDSRIHHKLHHVKTDTGRLSSSDPNLQNQPSDYSQVKDHFISRFENGSLISLDFSQLEICVQAGLSKDKQYIQDIINGVDFHIKRLALKEHKSYEEVYKLYTEGNEQIKQDRTKIKEFSFQRAYGAGSRSIAEKTGIPEEEIKTLIQLEVEEYPQLTRFNRMLKDTVESNKKNGVGWYQSITGRKYFFKENEAPEWLKKKGKMNTFMPTQIINHQVQGTATGDIVLIMLGKLWRTLISYSELRNNILLINTVHDDNILDVKQGYENMAITIIKEVINPKTVIQMLKKEFNIDWKVPIKIEIKQGKNWGKMEKI
jgi:DNA polymerase-1